jgi:hypothetical protein
VLTGRFPIFRYSRRNRRGIPGDVTGAELGLSYQQDFEFEKNFMNARRKPTQKWCASRCPNLGVLAVARIYNFLCIHL